MQSATANDVPAPHFFASPASPSPAGRRITSTPKDDSSFLSFLSRQFPQRLLRLLHVIQRELPRFDQMPHHRLRPPSKQPQQFVDQPPLRRVARYASLEN